MADILKIDITRKRGDTFGDEIQVISGRTKQKINLTGHTFLLTVDPLENPGDAIGNLYQLTGSITNVGKGTVEFVPSAAQADQLGEYFYDIQMIDDNARKRTIMSGKYTYTQDITKD